MKRPIIDYLVLDAVADDVESLEQIIPSLDRAIRLWVIDMRDDRFSREEVAISIARLIRERLIEAVATNSDLTMSPIGEGVQPGGTLDDYWFQITPRGRMVHSDWTPPDERTNSTFAT